MGLTAVFGMGTGVASEKWSPEKQVERPEKREERKTLTDMHAQKKYPARVMVKPNDELVLIS